MKGSGCVSKGETNVNTENWILLIGVGVLCASAGLIVGFLLGSHWTVRLMRFDNGLLKDLINTQADLEKRAKK